MGKRDNERKEAILNGSKKSIVRNDAPLTVGRRVEVDDGSVSAQVRNYRALMNAGVLKPAKLKAAIMKQTPKEMDRTIKEYRKAGKDVTVESLIGILNVERGFMALCDTLGIPREWFKGQAIERMELKGIYEKTTEDKIIKDEGEGEAVSTYIRVKTYIKARFKPKDNAGSIKGGR